MSSDTALKPQPSQTLSLLNFRSDFEKQLETLKKNDFVSRLWAKDASLWKTDATHQKIINNSLGWLKVAEYMRPRLQEILDFADEIKNEGFTDAVLLGMGGSSLSSELFRLCLPAKKGYPKLHVLDSTDPGWVLSVEKAIQIKKTLFIVSSKSGSTIEPMCFYSYFYHQAGKDGRQFAAVTDPGTFMEEDARKKNFRKIFLNPSDIGGRFSALSYFGMVPAGVAGMDIQAMTDGAIDMMRACGADKPVADNPGATLGAALGVLANTGTNKITFILPANLEPLGLWLEQLIAESSGKEEKGIVPIAGEAAADASIYGPDRLFVYVAYRSQPNPELEKRAGSLEKNHPVIRIELSRPEDLGAEFLRWEIATATACAVMGVNAFDQPDVQSAKDMTKAALKELNAKGSLPQLPVQVKGQKTETTLGKILLGSVDKAATDNVKLFQELKKTVQPGDYVGLLAFLPFQPETDKKLGDLRTALLKKLKAPTLFGYGPRYLHSTGQLHKGEARSGIFFVLTTDAEKDAPVPEQAFSFGQLEAAQAIGDFQTLDSKNIRVLRTHLRRPLAESLDELLQALGAVQ